MFRWTVTTASPIERQIVSFGRWLRFQNKSENTITIYVGSLVSLAHGSPGGASPTG
jgi:hypothetical protein